MEHHFSNMPHCGGTQMQIHIQKNYSSNMSHFSTCTQMCIQKNYHSLKFFPCKTGLGKKIMKAIAHSKQTDRQHHSLDSKTKSQSRQTDKSQSRQTDKITIQIDRQNHNLDRQTNTQSRQTKSQSRYRQTDNITIQTDRQTQ